MFLMVLRGTSHSRSRTPNRTRCTDANRRSGTPKSHRNRYRLPVNGSRAWHKPCSSAWWASLILDAAKGVDKSSSLLSLIGSIVPIYKEVYADRCFMDSFS